MKNKQWTYVSLDKKQICLLDGISKNSRFSGGRKLCRTAIIRAFLTVAGKLDFDVSNIKSEEDLKERFILSFRRHG